MRHLSSDILGNRNKNNPKNKIKTKEEDGRLLVPRCRPGILLSDKFKYCRIELVKVMADQPAECWRLVAKYARAKAAHAKQNVAVGVL